MIHLDTNVLVDLVTIGSPTANALISWLDAGESLATSAIAWSEFCNGPLTSEQKDAAFNVLEGRIVSFTQREAEMASRFFNISGRRRGSHPDCMIAAAAITAGAGLATFNVRDFKNFEGAGLVLKSLAV